jgi:hypothetical protein
MNVLEWAVEYEPPHSQVKLSSQNITELMTLNDRFNLALANKLEDKAYAGRGALFKVPFKKLKGRLTTR